MNTASNAVVRALLVTDIVESTGLFERLGDERSADLFGRHDRMARDLLATFDALEIDRTDGFLLLFERPIDAVRYALGYHRILAGLSEIAGIQIQGRVGIHVGEVLLRENPREDVARGAK